MIVTPKVIALIAAIILFLLALPAIWFWSAPERRPGLMLVAAGLFCYSLKDALT